MKKRYTLFTVFILIVVLTSLGVAAYLYLDAKIKIEPRKFARDKEPTAIKFYDRLMVRDMEGDYPSSPESVVDFFNDAFYLTYSNSIINDSVVLDIMMRQREVYSDELKELNPEELQFDHLMNSLEKLYADNNICLSVERVETVYDETTPDECTVKVMIYYNTYGNLYRNYYLIKDPYGRWKINGWQMTDDN